MWRWMKFVQDISRFLPFIMEVWKADKVIIISLIRRWLTPDKGGRKPTPKIWHNQKNEFWISKRWRITSPPKNNKRRSGFYLFLRAYFPLLRHYYLEGIYFFLLFVLSYAGNFSVSRVLCCWYYAVKCCTVFTSGRSYGLLGLLWPCPLHAGMTTKPNPFRYPPPHRRHFHCAKITRNGDLLICDSRTIVHTALRSMNNETNERNFSSQKRKRKIWILLLCVFTRYPTRAESRRWRRIFVVTFSSFFQILVFLSLCVCTCVKPNSCRMSFMASLLLLFPTISGPHGPLLFLRIFLQEEREK